MVIQLCNKDNSTQSFGKLQDEATKFQDLDLQLAYDHKQHNDDQAASEGKSRARKRVRLSMPQENLNDVDIRLEIISTVCHVLSLQDGTILPSLNDIGSILV